MSNPFPTQFNGHCGWCDNDTEEGEMMYAVDGDFICYDCAKGNNNICQCGQFKKVQYKTCFDFIHTMTNNIEKILETAERIVIDYANLSGRESANRAEFRKRVLEHLQTICEKTVEEERDNIWKWAKENSWDIETPIFGSVRVIDCDELAQFWREKSPSPKP